MLPEKPREDERGGKVCRVEQIQEQNQVHPVRLWEGK